MKLAVGSRVYDVESGVDGRVLRLVVDGVSHALPFSRLPGGRVLFDMGATRMLAYSDGRNSFANGRCRRIQPVLSTATAPAASLSPPMPAIVAAVLVAVGDSVEKGQKLLLLTAMKTEIAIRAPAAGIVTELRTKVGDQAMPGTDLVVLE